MPESKFMKEWKKEYASCSLKSVDYSLHDVVNRRINALAELVDKHLIEIKKDKESK